MKSLIIQKNIIKLLIHVLSFTTKLNLQRNLTAEMIGYVERLNLSHCRKRCYINYSDWVKRKNVIPHVFILCRRLEDSKKIFFISIKLDYPLMEPGTKILFWSSYYIDFVRPCNVMEF